MADAIIEVRDLRKVYGSTNAVDGLSLTLGQPGTVHGFLGPNGSGKTTTIRCLLNLIWPTSGDVRVFGTDTTRGLHTVAHRIGAIVENPKMFPQFSGRKNLSLLADIMGIANADVDRVLAVVGLADRGDDKFGKYSLGMKQRLAIAGALLKSPDLLILDEPANGLDPAGIAEMRRLIRAIADEGKAVLVSSHQLSEIEMICDDVTIINQGRVVTSGTLDEVRAHGGASRSVIVSVADRYGAAQVLANNGIAVEWGDADDEMIVDADPDQAATITRLLGESGHWLTAMAPSKVTLEQAFLELTGDPAAPTDASAPLVPLTPPVDQAPPQHQPPPPATEPPPPATEPPPPGVTA